VVTVALTQVMEPINVHNLVGNHGHYETHTVFFFLSHNPLLVEVDSFTVGCHCRSLGAGYQLQLICAKGKVGEGFQ
jgi:hypothetical protein